MGYRGNNMAEKSLPVLYYNGRFKLFLMRITFEREPKKQIEQKTVNKKY